MHLHGAVVGEVAADPLAVVVPECRAGDDGEALLGEAGDGEVALDAAARVEHLRVGHPPDVARDLVVAQALEQRGRARAGHLELGERRLVEDRHPLAAGHVLGADRGRPVLARPAARPQRLVAALRVRLVPVHALPARLLAEGGIALAVPLVRRGGAQRPAGLALLEGVVDVVVGLVGLEHARERVRGRAVLRAEAAHVHLPEVHRGLARHDPLRHHLAHAARAREAVCAEAARHEQAGHLRLAEAELVVGRESLRPVDHARDLHVLHLRHAPARVHDDLLEAVPVVLEQAAVEVGRDALEVRAAVRREGGRGGALVAAHHQTAALLAEVDEQVGVAQRRQRVLRIALAERLGHDVLVRHRHDRDAHAREPSQLRREHASRDHHDLGVDVAALGAHAALLDPRHARAREDLHAALAGALGQREGELRRVEVAVGGKPGGAEHAVGGHQREEPLRLLRRDQVERQPERLRPARLPAQLLHALLARREPDPAALDPAARVAELPVELDRVHHHLGEVHRAAQLAHEAGGVEGGARRELVAVHEHHVVPAELGQVVGDRRAAHAAPDDHAARCAGKLPPRGH